MLTNPTDGDKMSRYRFIVGATLAALEQELNRVVDNDPEIELRQVLLAPGTGFVAVIESAHEAEVVPKAKAKAAQGRNDQRKPGKA
jgi:hypothetical protein